MSSLITIYKKTHNVTGLKYLGKTVRSDVTKYPGSGRYWTNHIRKHGNDVTTEILFQSNDPTEIKRMGIYFSEKFDVVSNQEWANLVVETGEGAGCFGERNGMYGRTHTPEVRKKLSAVARRSKGKSYEERYGVDKASSLKKIRSEKMKGKNNKGKHNPRYDVTMYSFRNLITGEEFTGNRLDFYVQQNLPKSSVCQLIHGKMDRCRGWVLV